MQGDLPRTTGAFVGMHADHERIYDCGLYEGNAAIRKCGGNGHNDGLQLYHVSSMGIRFMERAISLDLVVGLFVRPRRCPATFIRSTTVGEDGTTNIQSFRGSTSTVRKRGPLYRIVQDIHRYVVL